MKMSRLRYPTQVQGLLHRQVLSEDQAVHVVRSTGHGIAHKDVLTDGMLHESLWGNNR